MPTPKNLHDIFADELRDLHHAEQQLVKALPRLSAAAAHPELQAAFHDHLEQTEVHVQRLEHIARLLNLRLGGRKCAAMEGLIAEGKEKLATCGDDSAKDASLICTAQKIEHYEIAGYGTAGIFAALLGYAEIAAILQLTLDEEGAADQHLTHLSASLNVEAAS
jgi:ferritin-like metal-binding protein YciE